MHTQRRLAYVRSPRPHRQVGAQSIGRSGRTPGSSARTAERPFDQRLPTPAVRGNHWQGSCLPPNDEFSLLGNNISRKPSSACASLSGHPTHPVHRVAAFASGVQSGASRLPGSREARTETGASPPSRPGPADQNSVDGTFRERPGRVAGRTRVCPRFLLLTAVTWWSCSCCFQAAHGTSD